MSHSITELVTRGESKTLEFKRDISSPKPILKSLLAFANTAGGRLVIGVADDKQLVGVDHPLDEEERLCNRIEVESPGILLSGLTIDDMKRGTSRIRNHVIARVFRELNLIEQWGTGVRRIFEEAKELGLPEPKIEEVGMRLRFTVYLAELHDLASTSSPTQSPTQSDDKLTQLVHCLQDGEKSAGELREMLGLKHRQSFRENYLHPALEQGLIERTIPEKPNSRLQKYRLTGNKGGKQA